MRRTLGRIAASVTMAAALGVGATTAATAAATAEAAPDAVARGGCWVESYAGGTFTDAWGFECVGVQARIDRLYQGKLISVNGKWGTYSRASSTLGTFVGNYVRANNNGTITTWVTVPWSASRSAVTFD